MPDSKVNVRKTTTREVEHAVLTKSRRRCAFCYFFHLDSGDKKGQIAHIDRNSSNSSEGNLVFLCMPHHDEYDSTTSQSKGLQVKEAKSAKSNLEEQIKNNLESLIKESSRTKDTPLRDLEFVSIEVYDRRYPVFTAFWKFVLSILREVKVLEKERHEFVEGISDALFLFGDEIDNYLNEVHREAMKLRGVLRTIDRGTQIDERQWKEAIEKEWKLMAWFEKELMSGRRLFGKYLRLSS